MEGGSLGFAGRSGGGSGGSDRKGQQQHAVSVDPAVLRAVSEQRIFLHDGVAVMSSLGLTGPTPSSARTSSAGAGQASGSGGAGAASLASTAAASSFGAASTAGAGDEGATTGTESPLERAHRLLCATPPAALEFAAQLQESRHSALRALWALHELLRARDKEEARAEAEQGRAGGASTFSPGFGAGALRRAGASLYGSGSYGSSPADNSGGGGSAFSSQLSLALMLPLLESQGRSDPALCNSTASVLLRFLSDNPPLSLQHEPEECLDGLESLLRRWLAESPKATGQAEVQREVIAGALIALAALRGSVVTFLRAVESVRCAGDLAPIPVAKTLRALGQLNLSLVPCGIQAHQRQASWTISRDGILPAPTARRYKHEKHPHELQLSRRMQNWNCDGGCGFRSRTNPEMPRYRCVCEAEGCDYDLCEICMGDLVTPSVPSLASDGTFLFVTGREGTGVAKLGTGLQGTIPGLVYCVNKDTPHGDWAVGGGQLLFRPTECAASVLCHTVNATTLEPSGTVLRPSTDLTGAQRLVGCAGRFVYLLCMGPETLEVAVQTLELPPLGGEGDGADRPFDTELKLDSQAMADLLVGPDRRLLSHPKAEELAGLHVGDVLCQINGAPVPALPETADGAGGAASATAAALKSLAGETVRLSFQLRSRTASTVATTVLQSSSPSRQAQAQAQAVSSFGGGGSGLQTFAMYAPGAAPKAGKGKAAGKERPGSVPTSCGLTRQALAGAAVYTSGRSILFAAKGSRSEVPQSRYTLNEFAMEQLSFNLVTGQQGSVHPGSLTSSTGGGFAHGRAEDLAVCCDAANNCLWSCAGMQIDRWDNPSSSLSFDPHTLHAAAPAIPDAIKAVPREDAVAALLDFVKRLGLANDMAILPAGLGPEEAAECFTSVVAVLGWATEASNPDGIGSALVILRALLSLKTGLEAVPPTTVAACKALVRQHMAGPGSEQACAALVDGFVVFFPTPQDQAAFVAEALAADKPQQDLLLPRLLEKLAEAPVGAVEAAGAALLSVCEQLFERAVAHSTAAIELCAAAGPLNADGLQEYVPASSTVRCLGRIQSNLFQRAVAPQRADADAGPLDPETEAAFVGYSRLLIGACRRVLLALQERFPVRPSKFPAALLEARRQEVLEQVVKSGPLGFLLPTLVTVMAPLPSEVLAPILPALLDLFKTADKALPAFFKDGIDSTATSLADVGPKSSVVLETVHPLQDGYKIQKTVTLAGASRLYLTFDPRCSSQYDYDKLCVYAGPTMTNKVAEYGGNTLGYGSRNVLGQGWPAAKALEVPGDTVTVYFEMKSGRETSTPDAAMWGFKLTVGCRSSLPFHVDLELALATMVGAVIQEGHAGPPAARLEARLGRALHKHQALAVACSWLRVDRQALAAGGPAVGPAAVEALRKASAQRVQPLRPSIKAALDTDALEAALMSAVISSCRMQAHVVGPGAGAGGGELPPWFQAACAEAFARIRALERQLSALAELELQWYASVLELREGSVSLEDAFFAGWAYTQPEQVRLLALLLEQGAHADDGPEAVQALQTLLAATAANDDAPVPSACVRTRALADILKGRALAIDLAAAGRDPGAGHEDDGSSTAAEAGADQGGAASTVADAAAPRPPELARSLSRSLSRAATEDGEVGPEAGPPSLSRLNSLKRTISAPPVIEALGLGHFALDTLVEAGDGDGDGADAGASRLAVNLVTAIVALCTEGVFDAPQPFSGAELLDVAGVHAERAAHRIRALGLARDLLRTFGSTSCKYVVEFAVDAATSLLLEGPVQTDVLCSQRLPELREAFASVLGEVVSIVQLFPVACQRGLRVCTIPFAREDAPCITRSGITDVLDRLSATCADRDVSDLAWAGFQLIALQCANWDHEGDDLDVLPQQIATLLSNHLTAAVSGARSASSAAVPGADLGASTLELLHLLDNLAASQLGRVVVSQPKCVVALLSLLVSEQSTPKMMHIIARLLAVALPLLGLHPALLPLLRPLLAAHAGGPAAAAEDSGGDAAPGSATAAGAIVQLIVAALTRFVAPSPSRPGASAAPQQQQQRRKDQQQQQQQQPSVSTPASPGRGGGAGPSVPTPSTPAPAVSPGLSAVTPPSTPGFLPFCEEGEDEDEAGETQSFHEHDLTLTVQPYGESLSWRCNECGQTDNGAVYHCALCHYDLCLDCQSGGGRLERGGAGPGSGAAHVPGAFLVRIHRRENQTARDVVHSLLKTNRRTFGARGDEPLEMAMRIDQDLHDSLSAVAHRGSFGQCHARAVEWAQAGLVASIEPDPDQPGFRTSQALEAEDRACRDANKQLLQQHAPPRRYVSGVVAGALATELVGLLQSLIATDRRALWLPAMQAVFRATIAGIPALCARLSAAGGGGGGGALLAPARLLGEGRRALAVLCVLGGFREDIHVGGHVLVAREGLRPTIGKVLQHSPVQHEATIQFEGHEAPLRVPTDVLQSAYDAPPQALTTMLPGEVVAALEALLQEGKGQPVGVHTSAPPTPGNGAAAGPGSAAAGGQRLLAELRTRCCMVLVQRLKSGAAARAFVDEARVACATVVELAREAQGVAGQRLTVSETNCGRLRRSFFEMHRPRPAHGEGGAAASPATQLVWDAARPIPENRNVVFSENFTVARLVTSRDGEESTPLRGAVLLASQPIPPGADAFYWEVCVTRLVPDGSKAAALHPLHNHPLTAIDRPGEWTCAGHDKDASVGGCGHVAGHTFSSARYRCSEGYNVDLCSDCVAKGCGRDTLRIGLCPLPAADAGRPLGATRLTELAGACLLRADGTATLRAGGATRSKRLPGTGAGPDGEGEPRGLVAGDVVGCEWRSDNTLHFQVNGGEAVSFDGVARSYPVVQLLGAGSEVRANFGRAPFAFRAAGAPGAAGARGHTGQGEGQGEDEGEEGDGTGVGLLLSESASASEPAATPCKTALLGPKADAGEAGPRAARYRLPLSGTSMGTAATVFIGEEEEEEEDPTERLIKAWEAQVFPKIRGRFRNNSERKSGQEQIRGALKFGMPDVARQTVEGLYEDNGGIPGDLRFPTLEDLKEETSKLGVSQIQSGMQVQVAGSKGRFAYEVAGMERTRGLQGTVVCVNTVQALALVDVYLAAEAAVVSWWFPCSVLEKAEAAAEARPTGAEHQRLLVNESELTRLYCRKAVLNLFELGLLADSPALRGALPAAEPLRMMAYEQHRLPIPARCLLRDATPEVFFEPGEESRRRLVRKLEAALEAALASGAAEALVEDLCSSLALGDGPDGGGRCAFELCELYIDGNQKSFSPRFEAACGVLVAAAASGSGVKASARTGESWARLYAGSGCTGPQFAQYPTAGLGAEHGLPYVFVPSAKLHVRTTVTDGGPGAKLVVHGVPETLPLALLFLRHVLVPSARAPPAALVRVLQMLTALLFSVRLAPALREMILRAAAQTVRRLGPGDHTKAHAELYDRLGRLRPELVDLMLEEGKRTSTGCHHSAYFQALLELVLAHWEVTGRVFKDSPRPMPAAATTGTGGGGASPPSAAGKGKAAAGGDKRDASIAFSALTPEGAPAPGPGLGSPASALAAAAAAAAAATASSSAGAFGAGSAFGSGSAAVPAFSFGSSPSPSPYRGKRRGAKAGRKKSKQALLSAASSSASPSAAAAAEKDEWLKGLQKFDARMRHMLSWPSRVKNADVLPPALFAEAMKRASRMPWARTVVVTGLPERDPARARALLKAVARPHGGTFHDHVWVELAADGSGAATGSAVIELRSAAVAPAFRTDLKVHPRLAALGSDLGVFEFTPSVAGGRVSLAAAASSSSSAGASPSTSPAAQRGFSLGAAAAALFNPAFSSSQPPPAGVVEGYLRHKLLPDGGLAPALKYALLTLFCAGQKQGPARGEGGQGGAGPEAALSLEAVLAANNAAKDPEPTPALLVRDLLFKMNVVTDEAIARVFAAHGGKAMTSSSFLDFVAGRCAAEPHVVTRALVELGFDLHFDRYKYGSALAAGADMCRESWSPTMDAQLVQHINSTARRLHVPPERLDPSDYYIAEAELAQAEYVALQNAPGTAALRLRVAVLLLLNENAEQLFPFVDLRGEVVPFSFADVMLQGRYLLFYQPKANWLGAVINATAQRTDGGAPEVVLDPLETVGAGGGAAGGWARSQFMSCMRQFEGLDATQLRVQLARGGDPTYPINVRLTGEAVQGSSGSYREFLGRMVHELHSALPVLTECPSAGLDKNKGMHILRADPLTYPVERALGFFGVLIGLSLRSDVPLALNILPCFWKSLVGQPLAQRDIDEADKLTGDHLRRLEGLTSEADFAHLDPLFFSCRALDGRLVDLSGRADGVAPGQQVTWATLTQYIAALRALRYEELANKQRIRAIRDGINRVLPVECLDPMCWQDVELKVCGMSEVNLDFLKKHTKYQLSLSEANTHVQFFWAALESFTQEELRMFIKFACNQDRIPCSCPCQSGAKTHVPPYPMMIAAPAFSGPADSRMIRCETCLFMVKLPQYSTQEIMTEQLHRAIRCREDPLSG